MKKYVTETSEDYALLDKHTGELLEFKQTRTVDINTFIMVFLASIPGMLKLKGLQLRLLMCCWKFSTFNMFDTTDGNVIHAGPTFKEACRREGLETSDACINVTLSELAKKGFLIRRCRGEYMLNPEYFFKGTLSNRSKIDYKVQVVPQITNK